jgi:hypothetical protein
VIASVTTANSALFQRFCFQNYESKLLKRVILEEVHQWKSFRDDVQSLSYDVFAFRNVPVKGADGTSACRIAAKSDFAQVFWQRH